MPAFLRAHPIVSLVVVLSLIAAMALAVFMWSRRPVEGTGELPSHLTDLGRVAVIGDADLLRLHAEGATLLAERDVPGLSAALDRSDAAALVRVMADSSIQALVVDGRNRDRGEAPPAAGAEESLRRRLASYAAFEDLQAIYLAPSAALYEPRAGLVLGEDARSESIQHSLAYVARAILGGARPPRVASFPEPLRRIRNVEIMVMIRDGETARLWRSARGSSVARALLTAALVARQRWNERQSVMGGSLDAQLASMRVEVYSLDEDGTVGSRSPAFIERAFTSAHGVAYEELGSWRYLLPEATQERGGGSFVAAYQALFEDSDARENSLERFDVRLYRLLARRLSSSPPTR